MKEPFAFQGTINHLTVLGSVYDNYIAFTVIDDEQLLYSTLCTSTNDTVITRFSGFKYDSSGIFSALSGYSQQ
jgi:hypothetical protein